MPLPSSETPQQRYYRKNKTKLNAKRMTKYYADLDTAREVGRLSQKRQREKNPELHRQRVRESRERTPGWKDGHRDWHLKNKYGISLAQKAEMLAAQGNVCPICETDTPGGKGWNVDHNHDTNAVRSILCHYCNVGLGHFKDNPALLRAAADYLERHKKHGERQKDAAAG